MECNLERLWCNAILIFFFLDAINLLFIALKLFCVHIAKRNYKETKNIKKRYLIIGIAIIITVLAGVFLWYSSHYQTTDEVSHLFIYFLIILVYFSVKCPFNILPGFILECPFHLFIVVLYNSETISQFPNLCFVFSLSLCLFSLL